MGKTGAQDTVCKDHAERIYVTPPHNIKESKSILGNSLLTECGVHEAYGATPNRYMHGAPAQEVYRRTALYASSKAGGLIRGPLVLDMRGACYTHGAPYQI